METTYRTCAREAFAQAEYYIEDLIPENDVKYRAIFLMLKALYFLLIENTTAVTELYKPDSE